MEAPPYPVGPAGQYRRETPPARNVNAVHSEVTTVGQRLADRMTRALGSWPFLVGQSLILGSWIVANVLGRHWDPYPFILLNLVLSFQAAYTGPIVMMSQNRQAQRDRITAEEDYLINQRAEREVRVVLDHLAYQDRLIQDLSRQVEALTRAVESRRGEETT